MATGEHHRTTLRRRVTVIIAAVLIVLLGVTAAAAVLLQRVQDSQDRVIQDYFVVIDAVNEQFVQYLDARAAVQYFVLTGEAATLEPFREVQETPAQGALAQVEEMFGSESDETEEVRTTLAAAERWADEWAEPIVEQVETEGRATIGAAEVEQGRALFQPVETGHAEFLAALSTGRTNAQDILQLRTTLLFSAVIVLAVATAAVAATLWYLTRRWVNDPIDELARETRVVSEGDLDHEVASTGPPEFVGLASDVDAMRRRLVEQIDVIEASNRQARAAQARLQARSEELQRSNRDLEQFAYVASHDLQEPLRKVASFCQMLQRRYQGTLDERADQYIEFAVDGATRMQQLINDLLTFSRVGRGSVPDTRVELTSCVQHAVDNLAAMRDENHARVTWGDLPTVRGDETLLVQLFQNLVGNAIKFRSDEPPAVHIGVKPANDGWELWCADNGIGIEAQYAERVFVIFQRLHSRNTYGGTGIGLAVCKKIVEHHGGTMWVDTTVQTGATVRWTMPDNNSGG